MKNLDSNLAKIKSTCVDLYHEVCTNQFIVYVNQYLEISEVKSRWLDNPMPFIAGQIIYQDMFNIREKFLIPKLSYEVIFQMLWEDYSDELPWNDRGFEYFLLRINEYKEREDHIKIRQEYVDKINPLFHNTVLKCVDIEIDLKVKMLKNHHLDRLELNNFLSI